MARWTPFRRTAAARFLVALAVPLACFVLAGCMLRLVYPRLDTIAVWKLDRELRLDRQQERSLSAGLEERLAWHQSEELPHWRDWLRAVRDDVAARRMTPERYTAHGERLGGLWKDTAGGFADVFVTLAAGLDDRQIAHFFARYDERTEEVRERLAETTTTERVAERHDEVLERAEDWLGSLTPEQEDTLAEWSRDAIDWSAHALESRQRWRAVLADALATRRDAVKLRTDVERMLRRPESVRSPAYQQALDRDESHLQALHLGLLETLTDEQRQTLLDEIDGWLDDLVALCAAASGTP